MIWTHVSWIHVTCYNGTTSFCCEPSQSGHKWNGVRTPHLLYIRTKV
jgi:hypothetical protein